MTHSYNVVHGHRGGCAFSHIVQYDALIYFGDTCEIEIFRIETFRMFVGESCPIQHNVKFPIYIDLQSSLYIDLDICIDL